MEKKKVKHPDDVKVLEGKPADNLARALARGLLEALEEMDEKKKQEKKRNE